MPCHFRRLWQAHHGQQAGREIAQRTAVGKFGRTPDIQKGHGIERVRGVRLVRVVIYHLLGIAVIGSNDDFTADRLHCFDDPTYADRKSVV